MPLSPIDAEFFDAVTKNDPRKILDCLDRGANINVRLPPSGGLNEPSALIYCGWRGFREAATILLENGADRTIRTATYNCLAVDIANQYGNSDLARFIQDWDPGRAYLTARIRDDLQRERELSNAQHLIDGLQARLAAPTPANLNTVNFFQRQPSIGMAVAIAFIGIVIHYRTDPTDYKYQIAALLMIAFSINSLINKLGISFYQIVVSFSNMLKEVTSGLSVGLSRNGIALAAARIEPNAINPTFTVEPGAVTGRVDVNTQPGTVTVHAPVTDNNGIKCTIL